MRSIGLPEFIQNIVLLVLGALLSQHSSVLLTNIQIVQQTVIQSRLVSCDVGLCTITPVGVISALNGLRCRPRDCLASRFSLRRCP